MKRSVILICVLLSAILALGGYVERSTHDAARRYQQALHQVGEAFEAARWEEALRMLSEISASWQKEREGIQLWVNHADTDAVTRALTGLKSSLQSRDLLSSRLYLGECLENFNHLHHRDAFTLKNIL